MGPAWQRSGERGRVAGLGERGGVSRAWDGAGLRGWAKGERGPGPSAKAGRGGGLSARAVGPEWRAGWAAREGRGGRGSGPAEFARLGLRVWVFLSNFYFFSKSNSNKV